MKKITHLSTLLTMILSIFGCSNTGLQPISIPFDAKKNSQIEVEFEIKEKTICSFELRFLFNKNDDLDRSRVKKLVGGYETDKTGQLIDAGVPIHLKIKIIQVSSNQDKVFFEKESLQQTLYSWGADSFSKTIEDVTLLSGRYKARIENLKDIPELNGTKVVFTITKAYRGK